jgi:hypothetical protein
MRSTWPRAENSLYYVHIEETFDVIKRAHIATGHGGRDRMLKELGKKYVNVTRDSIEVFKSKCLFDMHVIQL